MVKGSAWPVVHIISKSSTECEGKLHQMKGQSPNNEILCALLPWGSRQEYKWLAVYIIDWWKHRCNTTKAGLRHSSLLEYITKESTVCILEAVHARGTRQLTDCKWPPCMFWCVLVRISWTGLEPKCMTAIYNREEQFCVHEATLKEWGPHASQLHMLINSTKCKSEK